MFGASAEDTDDLVVGIGDHRGHAVMMSCPVTCDWCTFMMCSLPVRMGCWNHSRFE